MPTGVYKRSPKPHESQQSIKARFWASVKKSDGCWEWTGLLNTGGYGRFWPGRHILAHRYSWELANGPVPDGLRVCHTCDNRKCVRSDHLFIGTQRDNLLDAKRKGRLPDQRPAHCARGHAMKGKNVRRRYGQRDGRVCVTCATATRNAWREKQKLKGKELPMLRHKRLRAGLYETLNGRFQIQKDPQSGGERDGWGFVSWLVFEKGDDEPEWLGGKMHQSTLQEARYLLGKALATRHGR